MITPMAHELARRLLDHETVEGKPSVPTESSTLRVYEKLRRHLGALSGVAGFQSIASRALTLARLEDRSLREVQVTPDGSLVGPGEQDLNGEAGAIFIAQLLGLLLTFVGKGLTLRLMQDIWPEAAFDDFNSGEQREA